MERMSETLPITTPDDLKEWELQMGLKRNWGRMDCVRALDIGYPRYMRFRKGHWIPAHIGLAMAAIANNLQPYKGEPG